MAEKRTILLVGTAPDILETRRVILEGAGYLAHPLQVGGSVRKTAEQIGASLIIIDVGGRRDTVQSALEELSAAGAPSSIPVLVIGETSAFERYEGPGKTVAKPAEKRALLDSTRVLLGTTHTMWTKKKGR